MATAATLPKAPRHDPETLILPHSLEAERSCLGAALLHERAADYVVDALTVGDFFRRAHQAIFVAVQKVRASGKTVDLVTLKAQLTKKQLDEVGGPAYVTSLADGIPHSTNVEHYASVLRDLRMRRALIQYGQTTIDLVATGEHSANLLLSDADRRLLDLQGGHDDAALQPLRDGLPALMENMEWRAKHRGQLTGVTSGFKSVDELTLGWQPGDLIIIAARPSIGKTTLVMNGAAAACRTTRLDGRKRRGAVFSLEMRREQLEYRLLASLSGVPLSRLLGGYLGGEDYQKASEALAHLGELELAIDDRSGRTVPEMRRACRRMHAEGGLDFIIIDYVQLIPGTLARRGATRNEEVTEISRSLKALADELSVPLMLLSQLSRAADNRADPRPRLSDLRESGSLEQDADVAMLLHRKHHREGGTTQAILEKQRNGPTGTVNLTLDRDIVTFTDGGEDPPAPPVEEQKVEKKERQQKWFKRAHSH